MATIFSCFLIPLSSLFIAGSENWFTANFSVNSCTAPGFYYLIFWAFLTGLSFRALIRRMIGQAAPFLSAKKELLLTDLAVLLLMFSVLLPYNPEQNKSLAFAHVGLAFTATVLFYLVITALNLKLYFQFPSLFSLTTGLLLYAIAATFALLTLSDFLISSALEVFLTAFAGLWLEIFRRRIEKLPVTAAYT